jgi:UPF0176 protein
VYWRVALRPAYELASVVSSVVVPSLALKLRPPRMLSRLERVSTRGRESVPPNRASSAQELAVDSYYRFVNVDDPRELAVDVEVILDSFGLLGTVLIAVEGINVMLCGTTEALDGAKEWFESDLRFANLFVKRTSCEAAVFRKLKVKVKREIVPLGLEDFNGAVGGGRAVSPKEWAELLADENRDNVVVIDNRNSFEFGMGRFRNAIDPGVSNFRQFAEYFDEHLPEWGNRTIAMYCTGGIRCDKTAAWAASRGVDVVTLDGGILNFLQQAEEPAKFWDGSCFVFDERRELTVDLQTAVIDGAE